MLKNPVYSKIINLLLGVLFCFLACNTGLSQDANKDIVKRVFGNYNIDEYLQSNIFSLQKAPAVNIEDVINSKLNELIILGKYFKYCKDLENGNFTIDVEQDKVFLKILKDKARNTNILNHQTAKTAFTNGDVKESIEFDVKNIEGYYYLEMKNYKNLVDELGYMDALSSNLRVCKYFCVNEFFI